MNPEKFVKNLKNLNFENTFNPYSDTCQFHDCVGAPNYRARVLLHVLEKAISKEIDSIWIGRDLGYRGGRRTGLAFTDDVNFHAHNARWGVFSNQPTKGALIKERTATIIWRVLSNIEGNIFLWNVFPLHPHKFDNPLSNRSHNKIERNTGVEFLEELIQLLQPQRLIAIGEDAAHATKEFENQLKVFQVRHPSYGGQTQFLMQIGKLYGLTLK